jgi:hypothetical protein
MEGISFWTPTNDNADPWFVALSIVLALHPIVNRFYGGLLR